MESVHGNDETTDRPEHAIFNAANHPNPTFRDVVSRGSCNEQMDEGDEGDILKVDAEKQADAQDRLNRARDIHPGRWRLEAGLDEELQRCRHADLAHDVRDEEDRADDA